MSHGGCTVLAARQLRKSKMQMASCINYELGTITVFCGEVGLFARKSPEIFILRIFALEGKNLSRKILKVNLQNFPRKIPYNFLEGHYGVEVHHNACG